jgi:hypothetical protein
MKLSNDYLLPASLVSVIESKNYDLSKSDPLRIGVTTLNNPPRIRQLSVRHCNEIEEDVSEQLFRVLGDAVHYILAKTEQNKKLIEEKLTEVVDGITLVAKPDLYDDELKTIEDYKITTVWSVKSIKQDWLTQLNCYSWMLTKAGFEVKKAYINAILKDWSKNEKLRFGRDYPEIPFKRIEVPLWSFETQDKYIKDRIALYKSTLNLSDIDLPICSSEERWASPDKWAIHKNKNKTAKKLCSSYEEACEYVSKIKDTKNKYNIIKREGNDIRCTGYCSCNSFCSFYNEKYGAKK